MDTDTMGTRGTNEMEVIILTPFWQGYMGRGKDWTVRYIQSSDVEDRRTYGRLWQYPKAVVATDAIETPDWLAIG